MTQFNDVKDFHDKFGLPMEGEPNFLSHEESKFRIKCLHEELQEYERAVANMDLIEQFDALLDLVYFAMGTAHRQGFPWNHGFDRVHQANMSKMLGPNGVEIVKPDGWIAPHLWDLLATDLYESLKGNWGLITVDGPDGAGKTTLAKRIAQVFGGEHIHLTWTPRLDDVMDEYRKSAIQYAAALSEDRVVVIERPWISHPIYSSVYRNDRINHDHEQWRKLTEISQCIGIVAIPCSQKLWLDDYIRSCETRNEHYAAKPHSKMIEVFNQFALAFDGEPSAIGKIGLDPTQYIQYDYQSVNPVQELDDWIVNNIRPHLGIK